MVVHTYIVLTVLLYSLQDMLYRRLSKLQTLLSCNAQLDKAKPEKKAAVSLAREMISNRSVLYTFTSDHQTISYWWSK